MAKPGNRNNNNRNNPQPPRAPNPTPTKAPEPVVEEAAAPQVLETVEDEATKKVVTPVEPVAEDVVAEEPTPEPDVVEETEVVATTESNPKTDRIKAVLADLKVALSRPGKDPKEFREAARLTATLTKLAITNPHTEVLDTILAFFVAENDGVAKPDVFMKGSTTLPKTEEQQVGFLFTMFSDLANRRPTKINSSLVINILRKPEFTSYYTRKVSGFKSNI